MENEIREFETRKPQLEALLAEFEELGQPRSDFVLSHFVVGMHDLPERQRQQVLFELRDLLFVLSDLADDIRLLQLEIDEASEKFPEIENNYERAKTEILIGRKQRKITEIRLQMAGRLRECEFLYGLLESMPTVSREKFEAQEPEYWKLRLSRQYALGQRDHGGNLNAMLEMLTLPGKKKPELAAGFSQIVEALGLSDAAIAGLLGEENHDE